MALVVGAGVATHFLTDEPSEKLLAELLPSVPHVGRMNQSVSRVIGVLDHAGGVVAQTAIPYIMSVYGVFLADAVGLLQATGHDEDTHEPDDTYLSTLHGRFEEATGSELPKRDLKLFEIIRVVRNRLQHQAGTPGSSVATRWRNLPPDAKAEWIRIAGRPLTEVWPDRHKPMLLGIGELNATLAVTHRLAHRVTSVLGDKVDRQVWAAMVVQDYRDLWPRRFGEDDRRIRRIKGFARQNYRPLELTEVELERAIGEALPD